MTLTRWSVTLVWTSVTVLLMLSPGEESAAEDLSRFFGGTDITDALGHVVLYGVLTALWRWALLNHLSLQQALGGAVAVGLALGAATELAQFLIPHRGVALVDLLANWVGSLSLPLALQLLPSKQASDLIP